MTNYYKLTVIDNEVSIEEIRLSEDPSMYRRIDHHMLEAGKAVFHKSREEALECVLNLIDSKRAAYKDMSNQLDKLTESYSDRVFGIEENGDKPLSKMGK